MELYLVFYLFGLILMLKVLTNIFYCWMKYLNVTKCIKPIPGMQNNSVVFLLMILRNAFSDRNKVTADMVILQILCGLCHMFDKERITKFWIALRPVILFYKPETVKAILSSNLITDKAKEYRFLHPVLGTGLLTSTGTKWRTRRKLLNPTFQFWILKEFIPIYSKQSKVLVQKMKQMTHKEWVDIVPLITLCTLDIICETLIGVHINAQASKENELAKAIKEISGEIISRILRPWLWYDMIYFCLFPRGWQHRKNAKIIDGFTNKIIKEKKELFLKQRTENLLHGNINYEQPSGILKRRKAFLELLLEHRMNDNTLSEEDIREEVNTFVLAGHDTTAMSISWALYNIGLLPDVQEKIQMELESIFGEDMERPLTIDDLKAMKYLDCVVKESLRLYPSIPFIARELREDIQVLNYTVPKETLCLVFPYALHRDPEVYPNPEVFDPDRFLPENCAGRHPYAYIPFSAGPRNCIGQKFADMEEKIVLSTVLRNFIVKSLDERDKVNVIPNIVLRNMEPVRIKLIPR